MLRDAARRRLAAGGSGLFTELRDLLTSVLPSAAPSRGRPRRFGFDGGAGRAAAARTRPILLDPAERALELLEPAAQAIHLFSCAPHRPEPVDRGLDELVHLLVHLLHSGLDRALAGAHELVQQLARQERGPLAAFVEDHLGEGLGGHVEAGGVVHHPHLLPGANPGRQLLERDVAALLGVVELATLVALDQPDHRLLPRAPAAAARQQTVRFLPQCGMNVNQCRTAATHPAKPAPGRPRGPASVRPGGGSSEGEPETLVTTAAVRARPKPSEGPSRQPKHAARSDPQPGRTDAGPSARRRAEATRELRRAIAIGRRGRSSCHEATRTFGSCPFFCSFGPAIGARGGREVGRALRHEATRTFGSCPFFCTFGPAIVAC